MKPNTSGNKIIDFSQKINRRNKNNSFKESKKLFGENTKVISITSGKGGVGKTNIVANLGLSFAKRDKKVLILDADLGLGNLDILLGLAPRYNLSHVISGEKTIQDILVEAPGKMSILPASSGIDEFTRLSESQQLLIIYELNKILEEFDILLIDTAAGISSAVMYFNTIAEEIIIVVSPEPTSITDAYALMKVLSIKYGATRFKLLINQSRNLSEAKRVFRQLRLVTDRFMKISLEYLGHIEYDRNIATSVKNQRAIMDMFPKSAASMCFDKIANAI